MNSVKVFAPLNEAGFATIFFSIFPPKVGRSLPFGEVSGQENIAFFNDLMAFNPLH